MTFLKNNDISFLYIGVQFLCRERLFRICSLLKELQSQSRPRHRARRCLADSARSRRRVVDVEGRGGWLPLAQALAPPASG